MTSTAEAAQPTTKADELTEEGIALYDAGQWTQAIDILNKAIELNPQHALATLYRGLAYHGTKNFQAMVNDFMRARSLDPLNPTIHSNIGIILYRDKNYAAAIPALKRSIELLPAYEGGWAMLGDCYYNMGDSQQAKKTYAEMKVLFPHSHHDKLELSWMFPAIIPSAEAIDPARETFLRTLEQLKLSYSPDISLADQARYLPFYPIYHDRNNRELMEKMAEFFYKTAPFLDYTAPHADAPLEPKEKLRVGFLIDYKAIFILDQFVQMLLEKMASRDDFDILLILTNTECLFDTATLDKFTGKIGRYIVVPEDMPKAQTAIAEEKLDILIYADIAATLQPYFLAFARLAPIQCNMGTNPITSGLPTIDYFFSYKHYEPDNAQEHYTEKLVLFDGNLAVFKRHPRPEVIYTRTQLGLPEGDHLYCCPVMLYKLHPDMDVVFAKILRADPKARILLFDHHFKTLWAEQLMKRFMLTMSPHELSRVTFLPHAPKAKFFQVLLTCDAILDTLHYSFGTTAFLSLGLDVPFVTWPGEFARGRCSYMMYKQMGMDDLIAHSHDDYVALAVKLANDKEFYKEMSEKIHARSHVLYDDYSAAETFARRLKELYRTHTPS